MISTPVAKGTDRHLKKRAARRSGLKMLQTESDTLPVPSEGKDRGPEKSFDTACRLANQLEELARNLREVAWAKADSEGSFREPQTPPEQDETKLTTLRMWMAMQYDPFKEEIRRLLSILNMEKGHFQVSIRLNKDLPFTTYNVVGTQTVGQLRQYVAQTYNLPIESVNIRSCSDDTLLGEVFRYVSGRTLTLNITPKPAEQTVRQPVAQAAPNPVEQAVQLYFALPNGVTAFSPVLPSTTVAGAARIISDSIGMPVRFPASFRKYTYLLEAWDKEGRMPVIPTT